MIDPTALAALARIVPEGEHPGVADASLRDSLEQLAAGYHAKYWDRSINPGLVHLDAEADGLFGRDFVDLSAEEQDELLAGVASDAVTTAWTAVEPMRFHGALVKVANETYYATVDSPAWDLVGYNAGPSRLPGVDVAHTSLTTTSFAQIADTYDVVIVGAGAGGGTAAGVLARAGLSVLLAERGELLTYEQVGRDHLANHRLAEHGHNTGPDADGNPRVYASEHGDMVVERPWKHEWSNNAMTVGGGTRVYQGMAWRYLPIDFELASTYGVPEGSSLANWPVTYEDLEPFYTRSEWALGVCGDGDSHANQGERSRPYPMQPFPLDPEAEVLAAGAKRLGLSTGPVPLLVNSEPYNGRAACVGCGECVGFACPSDAKNGSWNTFVVDALATGRCHLVTGARATHVITDGTGRVDGVELVDWTTGGRRRIRAGHVVVAAGAIESPRLLLSSRSDAHPDGLGNETDQVGRHLQGHHYIGAFGIFDDPVIDMNGPGVTIGTCDWNHDPDAGLIGGCIHNEVIKLPIIHWAWALPWDIPRWGTEGKHAMRDLYLRTGHLYGPIQEIPTPDCRVTLAHGVVDKHGSPVARWGGAYHPDTVRAAAAQSERAEQWLIASGARQTWVNPPPGPFGAGQHQAGTCRMGDDPTTSVTDRWGRVHGHDNLWVMDASLHVTNGGFNPVLNIYALTLRSAEHLADS